MKRNAIAYFWFFFFPVMPLHPNTSFTHSIKNMEPATDKQAIEELLAAYSKALNASDVLKTVALYTTDGVIMPQGAPAAEGREGLTAAYEALYNAFQLTVTYTLQEATVHGHYAYARTASTGTTLVRASGATVPIDNKEVFVLRKTDGKLKIACYIFNNNKR